MQNLIDWNNKNWQEKENGDFCFDLSKINEKTFDISANKWSKVIANAERGVEKNQLRNFFDKVLELYEKSLNVNEEEFKIKILPFIKMLNSKVTYAKNKLQGSVNQAFVEFMFYSIKQIKDKETLKNFKYLFEAIIGFYEKENKKKNIFFLKQNYQKKNK